jgi:valyl-tRNA synthetase
LQHTISEVDDYFESFEFAKACDALYHFAWDDVFDWYVELAKPVLADRTPDGSAQATPQHGGSATSTRRVLGHVLDQLLRLLHPVMPFVTDELWSALTGRDTMVRDAWPTVNPKLIDDAAEADLAALQRVVTEVRRFRSDQGLKPGQRVAATFAGLETVGIAAHEVLIRSLVRLEPPTDTFAATATLTIGGGVTVALDTRGSIDVAAERARLTKDRAAADKEAAGARARLSNEAFTAKAPADVVAKIQQRLVAAEADLARIDAALAALGS